MAVDQPHDEEERHHRRHEIGVGDLPHAAVVPTLLAAGATANDDELVGLGFLAAGHSPQRLLDLGRPGPEPGLQHGLSGRDAHVGLAVRPIGRRHRPCRQSRSRKACSRSSGPVTLRLMPGSLASSASRLDAQLGDRLPAQLGAARNGSARAPWCPRSSPPARRGPPTGAEPASPPPPLAQA